MRQASFIDIDVALNKHVFCHCDGRHRVRPARIERQMCDDLGNLRRLHAMVEREFEVIRQRDHLVSADHRGEGDDATVAGRQTGPLPHLAEEAILREFVEAPE